MICLTKPRTSSTIEMIQQKKRNLVQFMRLPAHHRSCANRIFVNIVHDAYVVGRMITLHCGFCCIMGQVGHDGTAPGTGWFLKSVEVEMPTKGKRYMFDCQQWLSRDQSDGKTTRLFCVDDGTSSVVCYRPCQ